MNTIKCIETEVKNSKETLAEFQHDIMFLQVKISNGNTHLKSQQNLKPPIINPKPEP